jgi:hypothetical protein
MIIPTKNKVIFFNMTFNLFNTLVKILAKIKKNFYLKILLPFNNSNSCFDEGEVKNIL